MRCNALLVGRYSLTDDQWSGLLWYAYQALGVADDTLPEVPKEGEKPKARPPAAVRENGPNSDTENASSSSSEEDEEDAAAPARQGRSDQGFLDRQRRLQAIAGRCCAAKEAGLASLQNVLAAAGRPDTETRATATLQRLAEVHPQFAMGGFRNIWVVKPSAQSRGRGIFCSNRLDFVLSVFQGSARDKYVVQKYIERPLTIQNIKFDIRQWVLVQMCPMTIWFYKDSYLRFSSSALDLSDVHSTKSREIHLCNNSLQKHAEGFGGLDFAPECMWTSDEYIEHLKREGKESLWSDCIVPRMKEVVQCTMRCADDKLKCRPQDFEVFGFDFVLDVDYNVWLLEVNTSPDLSPSTSVTGTFHYPAAWPAVVLRLSRWPAESGMPFLLASSLTRDGRAIVDSYFSCCLSPSFLPWLIVLLGSWPVFCRFAAALTQAMLTDLLKLVLDTKRRSKTTTVG